MSAPVFLLNGPNLDLLGEREPLIYGRDTLADVESRCRTAAARHGLELICHQTNAEHQMIDWLHQARHAAGIVMNPAAFCYHSVPILDALRACECPIVEVHISNLYSRAESWRQHSILAAASTGVITGLGVHGYVLALDFIAQRIRNGEPAAS
jgi:3-dehydroquinate dehydratase-2